MLILWVFIWTVVSYYYGKIHFDSENIDKAYAVVAEFIKRDIKKVEKEMKN